MSERKKGSTSVSLLFRLTDSSTGAAKSGIDVTTLKLQYERPGAAASTATSLTLLGSITAAFTAYGAIEVDATNSKGIYRVDCPDLGFATGADEVVFTVTGAGIEPSTRLIDLTTVNSRAADFGLTLAKTTNITGFNDIAATAIVSGGAITTSGGKAAATMGSTDYTGNTPQTGDAFARLGAPAGVSIAADIAEIEAETDGIAAIPTSNPSAAAIAGAVWDALTSAHTVTGSFGLLIATDLDTNVGSRLATSGYTTPPTAAQNATAVWTDATAGDFTTAGTPGKILVGQLGGAFTTATSSVFTVGALANGPSGSGSTPAAIASAVWQDLTSSSDFTTVGSIGKLLAAIKLDGSGNAYSVDQFGNQLASLNQVSNVVGTGAAFNVFAASETLSIGTDTGGLANTFVSGGSNDTWTAAGGFIQGMYVFDLSSMPGAVPVAVYWLGYYVGAGNASASAFNWGTSTYDQIGSIANVAGSSQQASAVFSLTNAYVGTGANAGKVQVRFAAGPSATSFNTDRILLGCDVTPPANWNALGITSGGHISVVDTLTNLPGTAATAASQASILSAVGTPMQAGTAVALATVQPNYAPAKAGAQMDLVNAPNATAVSAIVTSIYTDTTASDFAVAGSPGKILTTQLGGAFTSNASSVFTVAALANAPSGGGGGGGDPWATTEPGSYISGTFGYLVSQSLASSTSWIMAAASYQAVPVPPSLINVSIPSNTPFTKTFTQGDLRTNIADILVDATGTPLNLSGSTIAFRMISQADKSVKVNTASANLDDAPNGKVSYSWQSADLNTPGLYWGWWIVTTGGKTEHFPGDGEKMTVKVVPAE